MSEAMERRILDFGINDTFESVAERWSIHYPTTISSNLVRRVVDRVGLRCEGAYSEESLQRACRKKSEDLPQVLVVATDGSMLLMREEGWKEAKVGVGARGDCVREEKQRSRVEEARYVAVLGGKQAFKKSLAAALAVERADEANSAHRHVLQVRMKRAGQRWGMERARRMVRLRAVYRTTGALRFHRAIREGLAPPACTHTHRPVIYDHRQDWRRSASK